MGALPRPEIPPGSQRDLVDALHGLHHTAGWPSLRTIAREVGVSPTTVSAVFSAPRLPVWGLLALIVEALGGDVEEFHRLWLAAGAPEDASAPGTLEIAGRRKELAVVRRHLESGTGMLLVVGEAGIGKTRLSDVAVGSIDVFVARCNALPLSTAAPFLPIATALRSIWAADDGQWVKEALAACPTYVPNALTPLLPELGAAELPQGADEGFAQQWLFAAVGAVLSALADLRQLALVVEDLHWADSATLGLLEHLLTTGTTVPVLGTYRLEDPEVAAPTTQWLDRVRRMPAVATVELGPLSRDETAEQLRLLAADLADAAEAIYARSQGQPLFTEQLAHTPGGDSLPRLLADVLDRRLTGLSDEAHAVARTVGVAARPLPAELVRDVSGLTAERLTEALRDLHRRHLLVVSDQVQLRHPLLADAVRRNLVPGEAVETHRRLASALADAGDPAEVAEHWRGAGDPEQELRWRIRAAQTAKDRIAAREEAAQWERALALWSGGDMDQLDGLRRIDAAIAALDAFQHSGQLEQAWNGVVSLLARVNTMPVESAAAVLHRAANYESVLYGVNAAIDHAAAAVAMFENAGPSRGMVQALRRYSHCLRHVGRTDEALAIARRMVDVSRSLGDDAEIRLALVMLAAHLSHFGWSNEIGVLLDEAHHIQPVRPDPDGDIFIGVMETDLVLKFGGGLTRLVAVGREGLAAAETWQLETYHAGSLRYNIGLGMLRAGKVERAAEFVDPHTDGAPRASAWSLHGLRVALDTARGRLDDAMKRLSELESVAAAVSEDRETQAIVSLCELWGGRSAEAFERLSRSLCAAIGSLDEILTGECQVLAVRAAADLADTDDKQRPALRRRVAEILSADDPTDVVSEAQHAYRAARTAELSRLAAEPRPDLWVAAAKEWEAINRPFEAAYARWRGAQAALTTGQGVLATKLLRRAAEEARGHVPLTEAIHGTRSQTSVPRT